MATVKRCRSHGEPDGGRCREQQSENHPREIAGEIPGGELFLERRLNALHLPQLGASERHAVVKFQQIVEDSLFFFGQASKRVIVLG
jgi:hypothetical protein